MSQTSDGIIITPVNVETDLGDVLGTGSGDVGTNCTSDNINPWAVYKPICNAYPTPVDSNSRRTAFWGLGRSADRNAEPPTASTISALIDFYSDTATLKGNPANGWRYNKPRGISYSEWHRVFDFVKAENGAVVTGNDADGYVHNIPNPFGNFNVQPTTAYRRYGHLYINNGRMVIPEDEDSSYTYPERNISITDLNSHLSNNLQMLYYGAVITKVDSSGNPTGTPKLFGNDTSIGTTRGKETMSLDVELTPDLFESGAHKVYPLLSNKAFTAGENNSMTSDRRLYPLPGATPALITFADDTVTLSVHATVDSMSQGNYHANWAVTISNNTASPVTLTGGKIRLRLENKSFGDDMISGEVEAQIPVSPITVPAMSGNTAGTYRYPAGALLADTSFTDPDLTKICVGFCKDGSTVYNFTAESTFRVPIVREDITVTTP